jgi:hypothetical protein
VGCWKLFSEFFKSAGPDHIEVRLDGSHTTMGREFSNSASLEVGKQRFLVIPSQQCQAAWVSFLRVNKKF